METIFMHVFCYFSCFSSGKLDLKYKKIILACKRHDEHSFTGQNTQKSPHCSVEQFLTGDVLNDVAQKWSPSSHLIGFLHYPPNRKNKVWKKYLGLDGR